MTPDTPLNSVAGVLLRSQCRWVTSVSSVLHTMSHNGDSQSEGGADERPETVSIGELLRSAHSISIDRYVTVTYSTDLK